MSKDKFTVAVIGTGMIANAAHIPAWKALEKDVEIIAVADIREEAAEETAQRYHISHHYTDPQKMLVREKPDIVSVCTPNVYHKPWTMAALQAGANVLCEKPLTLTYSDALEMYQTADSAGKVLYTSQSLRFMSQFQAAKEFAENGKLGEVYYSEVSAVRRRGVPTWGYFHMREHNAGGPICDLGVHVLDALYWITGNIRAVSASCMTYTKFGNIDEGLLVSLAESGAPLGVFTPRPYDYHEFNVEDFAAGFIRLENNATIGFKAGWAVNLPEEFYIRIAGTKGGLQLPDVTIMENMGSYQVDVKPKVFSDPPMVFPGHYGMIENFVGVIKGEQEMVVKREEVLNVVSTLEMLYKSAREGKEVRFEG
jgi:predicted dehydrogenase